MLSVTATAEGTVLSDIVCKHATLKMGNCPKITQTSTSTGIIYCTTFILLHTRFYWFFHFIFHFILSICLAQLSQFYSDLVMTAMVVAQWWQWQQIGDRNQAMFFFIKSRLLYHPLLPPNDVEIFIHSWHSTVVRFVLYFSLLCYWQQQNDYVDFCTFLFVYCKLINKYQSIEQNDILVAATAATFNNNKGNTAGFNQLHCQHNKVYGSWL